MSSNKSRKIATNSSIGMKTITQKALSVPSRISDKTVNNRDELFNMSSKITRKIAPSEISSRRAISVPSRRSEKMVRNPEELQTLRKKIENILEKKKQDLAFHIIFDRIFQRFEDPKQREMFNQLICISKDMYDMGVKLIKDLIQIGELPSINMKWRSPTKYLKYLEVKYIEDVLNTYLSSKSTETKNKAFSGIEFWIRFHPREFIEKKSFDVKIYKNDKFIGKSTFIEYAVYSGDIKLVELALNKGIDPNLYTAKNPSTYRDSLLVLAWFRGYLDVMDMLLRYNADPNDKVIDHQISYIPYDEPDSNSFAATAYDEYQRYPFRKALLLKSINVILKYKNEKPIKTIDELEEYLDRMYENEEDDD